MATLKYGILLQEGYADIPKFQVGTVNGKPGQYKRDQMVTVLVEETAQAYTDKIGQSAKVPTKWANGILVEWLEDSEVNENRTAIENAMLAYNQKHPQDKVTIDQLIL